MNKSRKHTKEANEKNRLAHLGKRTGSQNNKWKGNNVGYHALHDWVRRHFGKADKCENGKCKSKKIIRFEWANVSGEYKRDRNDWIRLCSACHGAYDKEKRVYRTHCYRGHILSIENLIIEKRGTRTCCKCKAIRARKSYMKNPQKIIKRVNEWRENKKIRSTMLV